ncbi:MAG: DEAD/DEAH box helicase [Candidatus Absconditabacteria bacterium]
MELYKFDYLELKKLVEYSSLLALSDDFFHLELSQKINSYLIYLFPSDKNLLYGIQMIYVRVGNYPIIKQDIFKDFSLSDLGNYTLDNDLMEEYLSEKKISKIIIGKKESYLNKFQKDILKEIHNNTVISISAPTSFGKSFIVRTYISQVFIDKKIYSVLIIVPSKALIDDYLNDLLEIKKIYNLSFNIITHFISDESVENKVFILTQERLLVTLRKNPQILKGIDLFYCDEAHKIAYNGRGFLLRRVIEEFLKYNSKSKKIFTSPIIKNPNYFLKKFFVGYENMKSYSQLIEYKPVEKNIFLYTLNTKTKKYSIFSYDNISGNYKKKIIINNIGLKECNVESKNIHENNNNLYKIDIINNSKFEGNSVIYVSGKEKLIYYSKYLSKININSQKIIPDDEIKNIKEYIEENFYSGLYILDFLKKGIGIHAGFLPVGLRSKIVELFKKGYLNYLLCTSTLLEGVNLPIKNIILLNTNSGAKNTKLLKTDFLNLIGRAGRFKYELSGNVILFNDYENKDNYDNYLNIQDEELMIKDVEFNILNKPVKKNKLVSIIINNDYNSIYKMDDRDAYEYIFYLIINDLNEINKLNLNEIQINKVKSQIENIKKDSFFNKNISYENVGISPISQKDLYYKLNSFSNEELIDFYSLLKDRFKIKGDLTIVLDILNNIFMIKKSNYGLKFNSQKEYQKILNWIGGKSINEIINIEISNYKKGYLYYQKKEPTQEKIDNKVLDELTYYSNIIGFYWVKYIRVFYNILLNIYIEKGISINKEEYEKNVESFLFTLETGINSSLGKYLYSIGLSRSIAVKVNKLLSIFIKGQESFDKQIINSLFSKKRVKLILSVGLSKLAYDELYSNLDL